MLPWVRWPLLPLLRGMVLETLAKPAIIISTRVVHLGEHGDGLVRQLGELLSLQTQAAAWNKKQLDAANASYLVAERRERELLGVIEERGRRCTELASTNAALLEEKRILEGRFDNLRGRLHSAASAHRRELDKLREQFLLQTAVLKPRNIVRQIKDSQANKIRVLARQATKQRGTTYARKWQTCPSLPSGSTPDRDPWER